MANHAKAKRSQYSVNFRGKARMGRPVFRKRDAQVLASREQELRERQKMRDLRRSRRSLSL